MLFAAGFAAAAGFGGAAVPAAFGVGGAVVLPSTESAIIPVFYLLIRNISRAYKVLISRNSFLYCPNPLPVKAKSGARRELASARRRGDREMEMLRCQNIGIGAVFGQL